MDEIKDLVQQARDEVTESALQADEVEQLAKVAAVKAANAEILSQSAAAKLEEVLRLLNEEEPPPTWEPIVDATNVPFTDSGNWSSNYHIWGSGSVQPGQGVIFHFHGDGAYEHQNPNASYCFGGANGMRAAALEHGYALVSVLAPDTVGSVTWWENGARNSDYVRELINHLVTKHSLNRSDIWLTGYSGGAQFITRFFLPKHGKAVIAGGGTLAIAGGGTPAVSTIGWDAAFKAAVKTRWTVGALDDGRGTDDGFNARGAAEQGEAHYRAQGFDTKLTLLPNTAHDLSGRFGAILQDTLDDTGTPPPGPTPTLEVTATPGNGQADVAWRWKNAAGATVEPPTGVTGYRNGRNGNDTGGSGPWETVDGPEARRRVFLSLINQNPYTFHVQPQGIESPRVEAIATPVGGGTTPPPTGNRPSGLAWNSGAFTDHKGSQVTALEQFRGRKLDIIDIHPQKDGNWAAAKEAWIFNSIPGGFNGLLSITMATWPRQESLSAAAAGQHRQHWREITQIFKDRGHTGCRWRIGVEMNLNKGSNGWHATPGNANQWRQAYRHAAEAIKEVDSTAVIVFNPNSGPSQTGIEADALLLGSGGARIDVVTDVIGVDHYDWYPPATSDANWQSQLTSTRKLQWWLDRASGMLESRNGGRNFALPEWGLYHSPPAASGGNDNPRFITNMLQWIRANSSKFDYECYFDEPKNYIQSSLIPNNNQNPNSRAAYRAEIIK